MACEEELRYLRFRHPAGFSEARMGHFIAHYRCWRAYVEALLVNWEHLPRMGGRPAPEYRIGEPRLSEDRRVISVELRGPWTLGSRALIEDGTSEMLWRYLPLEFILELEEGLAEPRLKGETSWRRALRPLETGPEREGERSLAPSSAWKRPSLRSLRSCAELRSVRRAASASGEDILGECQR